MFDGFFSGSKYATKTDKQKLEARIKDSVLNLVIDRDQSFLKTARANNTSVIVNNRDGGIQEFNHEGRRFISFPSGMEKEFDGINEYEAEDKMDSLLKLATTKANEYEDETQFKSKLKNTIDSYKDITGLDSGFEPDVDVVSGEIANDPFEYRVARTDKEKKDDADEGEDGSKGSCNISSKGMDTSPTSSHEQTVLTEGDREEREYSFQDVDLDVGASLSEDVMDNEFFRNSTRLTNHREQKLQALARQIVKSFKGRISKQRTMIPSKRLVSKTLVSDNTDKIYSNKRGDNGKHLNINLIIDMSGSMSGTPVNNSIEMIYIFNEIANAGYLEGNVIWSESSSRCKANFPMPREFVKKMGRTGGSEGLGRNLAHFKDELKKADTNICMTDGQLADDPILKSMYEKEKIDIIGVYVNKDAEDLTEYTGSLDRWFTRSLVRHTTEELCEKLIQFSLRKKK